jgi:hypothetical protein
MPTMTSVTGISPDELAGSMEPVFEDGIRTLKARLEAT